MNHTSLSPFIDGRAPAVGNNTKTAEKESYIPSGASSLFLSIFESQGRFLLLAGLLLCLFACEKERLYPVSLALFVPAIGPDPGCGWKPCDQAIAETRQSYQALANLLCDTVWAEVVCCRDGAATYALVFVAPQPARCREQGFFAAE